MAVDHPRTQFPTFSVLIPAFNEEALLPRTIASVRESFAELGRTDYEIIVCDNNSTDRTSLIAQSLGAQTVFEPHNQIGRARNAAAERSRGEWLLFLDADTLLHADLLRHTVRAIRAGGLSGGGSVLQFDRAGPGFIPELLLRCWNRLSATLHLAAGSYIFCLRVAWEAVGGFDEALYAGEEIHFSRAVQKWGRQRQLRFRVLTETPIITSARKLEWYSPLQLTGQLFSMLRPGARRRRDSCRHWYQRPAAKGD